MQVTKIAPAHNDLIPEGVLRLEYRSGLDDHADWALAWPGERRDLWVVVIHGHGSHGDQLYVRRDVLTIWLPEFRQLRAGILTVNLRDNAWMAPAAAYDLHELLAMVRAEWGAAQFIFCSGSMGGTSNLIYAVLHPEDVQALVIRGAATDLATYQPWCLEPEQADRPILKQIAAAIAAAYGGTPVQVPDVYRKHSALNNSEKLTMPLYFSHGGADNIIPVSQAQWLAEKMRNQKNYKYHEIPGGNHDSPITDRAGWLWAMAKGYFE
jgi:pimeloyl-ACP methyl ester carboxylesterase